MSDSYDLITLPRALNAFPGGLTTDQQATLPALITAASKAILRYCGRPFALASYDEVAVPRMGQWDRGESDLVQLRYFPVQSVVRVAAGRTTALSITNTSPANQRATVAPVLAGDPEWQTSWTGLSLARTAYGVAGATTLSFATYPTLDALASAINALGLGWSAVATDSLGAYPSADLTGPDGPQGAKGASGATFDLFPADLARYRLDAASGLLMLSGYDGGGNLPGNIYQWPGTSGLDLLSGWMGEVRVSYTAGWSTIPEPVQQACAIAVQSMYYDQVTANVFTSQTIGDLSYTIAQPDTSLPESALQILRQYKVYRLR